MKKTIIALMALAGVSAGESAKTIIFTFGDNQHANGIEYNTTGTFLGQTNQTYNILSSNADGNDTYNSIKYSDNTTATGITVASNRGVSGANGRVTTITNSAEVDKVFSSSLMKGVINHTDDTNFTINGLTIGNSYTMYVFAGRGNPYNDNLTSKDNTNTYYLSSGAESVEAQIVSYTVTTADRPTPTVSSFTLPSGVTTPSVTAYTQSCDGKNQTCENWVIMTFDFTANATSVTLNGTGSGTKSYGAIALVSNVPEPTTATLSLASKMLGWASASLRLPLFH